MMNQPLPVTFGRSNVCVNIQSFRITEANYDANLAIPMHEHRFPSWTVPLAGSFQETFARDAHHCAPGSVLSKPAGAAHTNRYGPGGARALLIELTDSRAALEPFASRVFTRVRHLPAASVGPVVRRIRDEFTRRSDAWQLGLHAALLDCLLLLVRAEPPSSRTQPRAWLGRVADRLRDEFRNPPTLDDLASDAGVHPVHLCGAFRARYRCSPGDFVRRHRIACAQRMLAQTEIPLSAIAYHLGYFDQSHFTRQFRSAVGLTPWQYRRRHAGPDLRPIPEDLHSVLVPEVPRR